MIKKFHPIFALIFIGLAIHSCKYEDPINPFLIGKHHVGLLTDSTQVKDLKIVFENDSISTYMGDLGFVGMVNNIHILDSNGKHMLTLSPTEAMDSTATISSVRIEDARFSTENGISLNSNFGELSGLYQINKIDNLINNIVVSVDEINASFTIDKEELPANMRFDMSLNIDPIQIPDEAKIKYFMLHW